MSDKKKSKKPAEKPKDSGEKPAKKSSGSGSGKGGGVAKGYFQSTLLPVHSFLFVLPFILFYEIAIPIVNRPIIATYGEGEYITADKFIRHVMGLLFEIFGMKGASDHPLRFGILSGIFVAVVLFLWVVITRKGWQVKWTSLLGMLGEAALYGFIWWGIWATIKAFSHAPLPKMTIEPETSMPWLYGAAFREVTNSVGAGVYEEFLFRMAALSAFAVMIFAITGLAWERSRLIAILPAALIFAGYHHLGPWGDAFTWPLFLFRAGSGVAFGMLYVSRGFGIAVGTHAVYDICASFLPVVHAGGNG